MKPPYFIIIMVLSLTKTVLGQNYEIEGSVINKETKEPIPYANIYNQTLRQGTISNTDGYFRIPIRSAGDSVRISFIGFNDQLINLQDNVDFYSIRLEARILLLGEVTVTPDDNSYLFDLIEKCRKSTPNIEIKSKAYYALKSFIDSTQVELVEGYYNTDIKGYKLINLNLKAGRLALQPSQNRYFASLESSRVILMLNLFDKNRYFPKNPLELRKSKLKKAFYLTLENKYLDEAADSMYVIGYKPKNSPSLFFEGKIWINKTKSQIIKITLNCNDALIHPFLPLFTTDSISKVSFAITQSFKSLNSHQAVFHHTDFIYKIDYKSRIGEAQAQNYSVTTNAVLYTYDYNGSFFQPIFDFTDNAIGDYRKINALPYNDFFWTYNDEYRLNDSLNANEAFFSDKNSLTNKTLFNSNEFSKKGLFEHPFVAWSKARIKFREMVPDTSGKSSSIIYKAEQYNLSVKIYLDMNTYRDSTHIETATIFDPYESYYYLPIDNKTNCFVNIYFDLCEIERRELEENLEANKTDSAHLLKAYDAFTKKIENERNEYLKAVQRGTNESEMVKYNPCVYEKLGIDNIEIFQPFRSEE